MTVNIKCGGRLKCKSFRMYFNLNDHQFKTNRYNYNSKYINPMVTANRNLPQISKKKKKLKHFTEKSYHNGKNKKMMK